MSEITNVNIQKMYDLKGLRNVVVQKANVGSKFIYALQLKNNGSDEVEVYRANPDKSFNTKRNMLCLYGPNYSDAKQPAGGHTQTWEYAGDSTNQHNYNGEWFIGTKGKVQKDSNIYWDTQIARVKFSTNKQENTYTYNTELSRISNLNQAGRCKGLGYDGRTLVRSEAAVSPSQSGYNYFLIITVDNKGTGYFSLYNLVDINDALNKSGKNDVNLKTNDYLAHKCIKAFKIDNLTTKVGSLQGFDIDENLNIYISSEKAPTNNKNNPRKIVKIPWNTTETNQWTFINLDNYSTLDIKGHTTEFEGIQVINENNLYLTVAYHGKNITEQNIIYNINWVEQ